MKLFKRGLIPATVLAIAPFTAFASAPSTNDIVLGRIALQQAYKLLPKAKEQNSNNKIAGHELAVVQQVVSEVIKGDGNILESKCTTYLANDGSPESSCDFNLINNSQSTTIQLTIYSDEKGVWGVENVALQGG